MSFLKKIFNAFLADSSQAALEKQYEQAWQAGNRIPLFWPGTAVLVVDKKGGGDMKIIFATDGDGGRRYEETPTSLGQIVKLLHINIKNNTASLAYAGDLLESLPKRPSARARHYPVGDAEIDETIKWRAIVEHTIHLLERETGVTVDDPIFSSFKSSLAREFNSAARQGHADVLDAFTLPVREALSAGDADAENDSKKIAQKTLLSQLTKSSLRN